MADPTPAEVERLLALGLACDHLQVDGDGRHLFATIVSPECVGATLIERYRA